MKNSRLQVGLDISRKRLDGCMMRPDGEVLMNHRSFANNRPGYEALQQVLQEEVAANGFDGVDIGAEATGYYWLPFAKDSFYVTEKLRTQRNKYHAWSADEAWLRLRFCSRLRDHIGQAVTREKNYFWSHMFLKCSDYRAGQPFGDGLAATGRALICQYPDWQCLTQLPDDTLQA